MAREDEIEDDVEVRALFSRTTLSLMTISLIFSTKISQSLSEIFSFPRSSSLTSVVYVFSSSIKHTQDAPPSHVSTIDDAHYGEPLSSARTLCRNSYRLGFFGLPFVWGACAYYFSSSSSREEDEVVVAKRDKVVDEYVAKMRFGFKIWIAMASSWTIFWLVFGESVFGRETWERASVARSAWVERVFFAS